MWGHLGRRALWVLPVAWALVTLLFLLLFVVPGHPVERLEGRALDPEARAAIEAKYGVDKPWYVQYGRFWERLAHGDLGESFAQGRRVNDIVATTAPASLRLALWAVGVELVIGLAAGLVAVLARRPFLDAFTAVATSVLIALPVFVLGALLQYMLGIRAFQHGYPAWARFPVQGIGPDTWTLFLVPTGRQWKYLVLPALTLGAGHAALLTRLARSAVLDTADAAYTRTAAAKGLSEQEIVLKHALRPAAIPILTVVALDVGSVMGSAIVTEAVFNWPGMGSAMVAAANRLDRPVILGLTLVLLLAYVTITFVVDALYAVIDPRVRHGPRAAAS